MGSDTVQWCNLQQDMLIMVAKRLDTRTDTLRLRAVCSSWRSSLPRTLFNKSPLFSVKFPFPIGPNPDLNPKRGGYFTLTERTIYYLEPEPCSDASASASASTSSPKGWMVKVAEDRTGKMRILNDIFSHGHWSVSRNASPQVLNLLNFRVSEISKVYGFRSPNAVHLRKDLPLKLEELKSLGVWKVVMSSSIPAWIDDDSNGDNCAILTLPIDRKLGYFRLGDKKWSIIDDDDDDGGGQGENSCFEVLLEDYSYYEDILYHKEKFYAIHADGKMIVIDSTLDFSVIESPVNRDGGIELLNRVKYKFLVESNGDVYFVYNTEEQYVTKNQVDPYYSSHLEVFKFNEEEKHWVQVTSLGDQAFFVGEDCCFSVSARQFSGCKGNCIYFRNNLLREKLEDHPGYNFCIFDLEDQSARPLSSFEGYSQIFWPSPTWLQPEVSSESSSSKCSI